MLGLLFKHPDIPRHGAAAQPEVRDILGTKTTVKAGETHYQGAFDLHTSIGVGVLAYDMVKQQCGGAYLFAGLVGSGQ